MNRAEPVPAPPPAVRWWRASLALAAVGLVIASLALPVSTRRERERLRSALSTIEIPPTTRQELVTEIDRNTDPVAVWLAVAGRLVDDELGSLGGPVDELQAHVERLVLARRLAAEAWRRRPAAWRAPTLLGAATYLERRVSQDSRLVTSGSDWEVPLQTAHSLAPAAPGPASFLLTAYLELWTALPPDRRDSARDLLTVGFRDPGTFNRLIDAWLLVTDDPKAAMEPLPDLPHVWATLERRFAERRDWPSVGVARTRWQEAIRRQIESVLADARRHAAGGDLAGARELYYSVLATAPPERSFAPLVEHALTDAPPGPGRPGGVAAARGWLDWCLNLASIGRCPFDPDQVARLAGLAGKLPADVEARAALAAAHLDQAERIERRSADSRWKDEWIPYWIAKSRQLLDRDKPREAAATLARAPGGRDRLAYLLLERDVARASGDAVAEHQAARQLDDLREATASGQGWRRDRTSARTELWTPTETGGIDLQLDASGQSSLVELRLDGRSTGLFRARGATRLRLDAILDPGIHRLEVVMVGGAPVTPRSLRVRGDGAGGRAADHG